MSTVQELRNEANKVIRETQAGGNSASRIGNLYNGIIDFIDILNQRTEDPYYYDDTELRNALSRVDDAIAQLDSALQAALAIANQERQRLDDLINSIDGEINEKVEDMLNDAQWLQDHARGIQELVNEGEIYWKSEWDENIEAYLQEVGVWAREGDVVKTQWTEVKQSVDEISSTVAEVQQDLSGRPTSTQWSQISQKVDSIEQSVNALLYQGETTEALQSSINQSIDNKVASLKLETTYAKLGALGDSTDVIEWMYSALRNETSSDKTYNDIVSAGKSGLTNAISDVHTYVEAVRNGEVLDHVAGAAIEAKVNDAITGLYSKATPEEAVTTIFSQVKKDTQNIAAILVGTTGSASTIDIVARFENWKSGLMTKAEMDGVQTSIINTLDGHINTSAVILNNTISESNAAMTAQLNDKTSAVVLQSTLEKSIGKLITATNYTTAGIASESYVNGATAGLMAASDFTSASVVAKVNAAGSSVLVNADQINFKTGTFKITNGGTTTFSVDSSGNVSMRGSITASSGAIGGFTITDSQINSTNNKIVLKSDGSATFKNVSIEGLIYANKGLCLPVSRSSAKEDNSMTGSAAVHINEYSQPSGQAETATIYLPNNPNIGQQIVIVFAGNVYYKRIYINNRYAYFYGVYDSATGSYAQALHVTVTVIYDGTIWRVLSYTCDNIVYQ